MNSPAPSLSDAPIEGATPGEKVRMLRRARGETGEQFGAAIGLSKSKVSELESGLYSPGVQVATAIEALSGGRIDAAELCEDVRLARESMGVHARQDSAGEAQDHGL